MVSFYLGPFYVIAFSKPKPNYLYQIWGGGLRLGVMTIENPYWDNQKVAVAPSERWSIKGSFFYTVFYSDKNFGTLMTGCLAETGHLICQRG